ncbi:hypothetical protein Tco_0661771 [Tanacetum coccineum]
MKGGYEKHDVDEDDLKEDSKRELDVMAEIVDPNQDEDVALGIESVLMEPNRSWRSFLRKISVVLMEPNRSWKEIQEIVLDERCQTIVFKKKAQRLIAQKAMVKNTGARGSLGNFCFFLSKQIWIPHAKTGNKQVDAVVIDEESGGKIL